MHILYGRWWMLLVSLNIWFDNIWQQVAASDGNQAHYKKQGFLFPDKINALDLGFSIQRISRRSPFFKSHQIETVLIIPEGSSQFVNLPTFYKNPFRIELTWITGSPFWQSILKFLCKLTRVKVSEMWI